MSATYGERLLGRVGLDEAPAADAEGLRIAHRAFVSSVPYENLAVQLGETGALDPEALCERILSGRGGYCFEINSVLVVLLEALGFSVERRQGIVGPRSLHLDGEPTNHMALVATTPRGEEFIVEAGWGEGAVEPIPLSAGRWEAGPFRWELEREGEGWWVGQHEFGSTPGFRFDDRPAAIADFEPHHQRLATSPDSSFVKTLIVQQPHDDRIVTLRARTLSEDGPALSEQTVLPDRDAFAGTLAEQFGIEVDLLGRERVERLWSNAVRQHEEFEGR